MLLVLNSAHYSRFTEEKCYRDDCDIVFRKQYQNSTKTRIFYSVTLYGAQMEMVDRYSVCIGPLKDSLWSANPTVIRRWTSQHIYPLPRRRKSSWSHDVWISLISHVIDYYLCCQSCRYRSDNLISMVQKLTAAKAMQIRKKLEFSQVRCIVSDSI